MKATLFFSLLISLIVNISSLFIMSSQTPKLYDPCYEVFESTSYRPPSPKPRPPLHIPTSHSCPNIKPHSASQRIHEVHPTPTTSHPFQESELEDACRKPASAGLSGKTTPANLSKRPVSPLPPHATRPTNIAQNGLSIPFEPSQNTETKLEPSDTHVPPHLAFLAPLDLNDRGKARVTVGPFTGGVNRESPVWRIIELKLHINELEAKLANHEDIKKKAEENLRAYEALLAEFENIRHKSKATLEELENDKAKVKAKAKMNAEFKEEASRQRKSAGHWESLYDKEATKVVTIQNQLENVLSGVPSRQRSCDASTQTPAEDAAFITGNKEIYETSVPASASPIMENEETDQAAPPRIRTNEETMSELVEEAPDPGSDTCSTLPDTPRPEFLKLRCNFSGILEDILEIMDGVHESNP